MARITLKQLVDAADKAFPDGLIRQYYDEPDGEHGDTLARFIVLELQDTFDGGASNERKVRDAARAIERAIEELQAVMNEINDLRTAEVFERMEKFVRRKRKTLRR